MKKKLIAIASIVAIVGMTATILVVSNNRKEDEE
jgi:hypothetical protein